MGKRADNNVYIWMQKRADRILNAMRSPTKRVSLSSTSNPIKGVDGGPERLSYVDIHVDDEGDEKEVHYSDSPRTWTERGPR